MSLDFLQHYLHILRKCSVQCVHIYQAVKHMPPSVQVQVNVQAWESRL